MDYKNIASLWLASKNVNENLKNELKNLNDEELQDAFYKELEFGTGGLRGIIGVGTNRMNEIIVKKASLGFGKYLLKNEENVQNRGVVIAHDNRYMNEEFTYATASALTSLGIKVYIFDSLRATPQLSFAVRYLGCVGGVNITASHNPKEYNGYKIYNADGNQLILEQSNKVLAEISQINNILDLEIKADDNLITVVDSSFDDAYNEMVKNIALRPNLDKSNITIIYTPEHGAGYVPVKRVLTEQGYNLIEVKEQSIPYPDFPNTASPNPEERGAYEKALEYAKDNNPDLICATDPDSDRIGIVVFDDEKNPIYMTGNQTGALLIDYICNTRKELGLMPSDGGIIYNTIVSSPLGAKIANSYGVEVENTLTGFKYIGDKIKKSIENHGKTFIMGYEESYGYLISQNVRDKDAIQSVMMICEMASYYKYQGITLYQKYLELEEKYGFYIESQYNYKAPGITGAQKIESLMSSFRNNPLTALADELITTTEDYLSLKKNTKGVISDLDYEKSNVLRYLLEDDSFVAIRPSGTEPKVKFYFAIRGISQADVEKRHEKIKSYILNLIK